MRRRYGQILSTKNLSSNHPIATIGSITIIILLIYFVFKNFLYLYYILYNIIISHLSQIEALVIFIILALSLNLVVKYDRHLDELSKELKPLLSQNYEYQNKPNIADIHKNLSFIFSTPSIIRKANHEISILGIDLIFLLLLDNFWPDVMDAIHRNIKVHILIINPNSRIYKDDNDFKRTQTAAIQHWYRYYNKFVGSNQKFDGSFEIRIYDEIPMPLLILADTQVGFSPYLKLSTYLSLPFIWIKSPASAILDAYRSHFETTWNKSQTISDWVLNNSPEDDKFGADVDRYSSLKSQEIVK